MARQKNLLSQEAMPTRYTGWACPHRAAALICVVVLSVEIFSSGALHAQQHAPHPSLYALYPVGAERGKTVNVKILSGLLTDGATGLVFSHPGIVAKPVMRGVDKFYPEPRAVENTFAVSIADDVPFGIYDFRAIYPFGVSNARKFVVDRLPTTVMEIKGDNAPEQETEFGGDIAVYGAFELGREDRYHVRAKAGQTLIIDCQAERLDSRADATLVIQNSAGQELARAQDSIGRDPWIAFSPPADGVYVIRLFDLVYGNYKEQGSAPYRLSVTTGPWLETIDPPVAQRGQAGKFTLYGWNLGQGAQRVTIDGRSLEKLEVKIDVPQQPERPATSELVTRPAAAGVDTMLYQHKTADGASNLLRIALATDPVVLEREPNDDAAHVQRLSLPCDVCGRFDRPGDKDRYEFEARKDDRLWIEVVSQRLDQPTDPLLVVQQVTKNDAGETQIREITVQDDPPPASQNMPVRFDTDDPALLFTVPADGVYRVLVRNQAETLPGGPRPHYQLSIHPPRPDFRLIALADLPLLNNNNERPLLGPRGGIVRRGGAAETIVVALRREGFRGEIRLSAKNLPTGVTAAPAIIAADSGVTALLLRAASDAPASASVVEISGQADIAGESRTRTASGMETVWSVENATTPFRLASGVNLAVDSTIEAPGRIQPAEQKVWRTARGGKLEIPVRLVPKSGEGKPGAVNATAAGLPDSVRASGLNVEPGKESKLQIDVETTAAAGAFTFFLRGEVQQDYRRNPERAEQAKQDKERITRLAKESTESANKANQERQKAEQDKNRAKQQADEARQKAEQLKQKSDADPQKRQQAEDALKEAETKLTEAENQFKQATDADEQARKDVVEANRLAQDSEQTARRANDAAQSQKIRLHAQSDPIIVEIAPYALDFTYSPAQLRCAAGGEVELAVSVVRNFECNDEINLDLGLPSGVSGIRLKDAKIPKDQKQAKLTLVIDKNTKPGDYELQVIARYRFNGRGIDQRQAVQIRVEAPVEK